jgi:curli biogenesis system outer membrane secretion channel CsgG
MKKISIVLTLLAVLGLAACKTAEETTRVETSGPTVQEALTYEGPKARIAVADFKCKAAKCSGEIGSGLSDMISTALFQSNRFIVLERGETLDDIKEELALAQSGYTEEGKAAEMGLMEGADILLTGAVTAFEPEASGGGGGVGIIAGGLFGVGGAVENAYIAADLRLVDVRRSRVISAAKVEGEASSWKLGGLGGGIVGGVALGGALGGYKNTPMEKALRVMLDRAVDTVANQVPQNYYRYSPTGDTSQTAAYQPKQAAPEPAPAPEPEPVKLMNPFVKEDAKKIQARLKELGYYTSVVDGIWGKGSQGALAAFMKNQGLPQPGIWSMEAQKALFEQ